MSAMLKTLFRTVILDEDAFQEWHERPNLFLRGIVLIAIITLVAGLVSFSVDLANRIKPVEMADIREQIEEVMGQQSRWNPFFRDMDPEARQIMDQVLDTVIPMVTELSQVETPLPKSISGLFQSVGSYLSRVLAALGGWLFYGALALVAANLLGGTAKLPNFLGMIALYAIPGLLSLLRPIPCVGGLLALVGTIWSIVVYVKAVSFSTKLDTGRSILAVFAPFIILLLLGILVAILGFILIAIAVPS